MGVFTIISTFCITYALLGIEEIGHLIEEPFTSTNDLKDDSAVHDTNLPLDDYCNQIQSDVLEMINSEVRYRPSTHVQTLNPKP